MGQQMPDELRHAYRALLRAATYLPDSAARTYIHNYAVQRFRSVADKIKSKSRDSRTELITKYHDKKRIGKVWQAAHQLERAGQGSVQDLERVLFRTYGRSGKRRRELIQELLKPEEADFPEDQAALEELIQKPSEKGPSTIKHHAKLSSFVKSQLFNPPLTDTGRATGRAKLRQLEPIIPKENLWGRTVPLKLQESIKKRHWADTLDRLFPPVPRHEWERLRDLATGTMPIEEHPPRRSRPSEVNEPIDQKLWEYFSIPTNRQNKEMEAHFEEGDIVIQQKDTTVHTRGLKHMTPRFMRRLYATIWNMTPTMSQDQVTKTWTTKWGGGRSAAHCGQITKPSARDIELFEGATDELKPAYSATRQQRKLRREQKRVMPGQKPAPNLPLGDEGYAQGAVPSI